MKLSVYENCSVLVIDDHPFIRQIVVGLLRRMGFKSIEVAEDGEDGLNQCNRHNPDLIICDIDMEPMNGLDFIKRLRESEELYCHNAPVVFLTAHDKPEIIKDAIAYGACGYIVKPVSPKQLQKHVDKALEGIMTG